MYNLQNKKVGKGCLKRTRQTSKKPDLHQPKMRQESTEKEIQKKSKKTVSSALIHTHTSHPSLAQGPLFLLFAVSQIWGVYLSVWCGRIEDRVWSAVWAKRNYNSERLLTENQHPGSDPELLLLVGIYQPEGTAPYHPVNSQGPCHRDPCSKGLIQGQESEHEWSWGMVHCGEGV